MTYDNTNEIIKEIFEIYQFLSKHQIWLEASRKGSNFIFDLVQLFYYKCHKINFKRGGSYIESPHLIKNEKATIKSKNKDDRSFQYAVKIALNYDENKKDLQRCNYNTMWSYCLKCRKNTKRKNPREKTDQTVWFSADKYQDLLDSTKEKSC